MKHWFKSNLKKYKKAKYDKNAHIRKYYLDEMGNAVIRIQLENIQDAFSAYSPYGYEELNRELADYIDSIVYHIPLENSIVLMFDCGMASDEEKQKVRQAVLDYYGLRLEDKKQDFRINRWKILGLFGVGAILLTFSYFLANHTANQFFFDFMNIAGTFALWEAVDLLLLERQSINIERLNAGQTVTAKVIFATTEQSDCANEAK